MVDLTVDGSLRVKGPNPWYDVQAFGAVGDGVTDDTYAINNALQAATATGGTVFFPTCRRIDPASNATFQGATQDGTLIGKTATYVYLGKLMLDYVDAGIQLIGEWRPGQREPSGPELLLKAQPGRAGTVEGEPGISLRQCNGVTLSGLHIRCDAAAGFHGDLIRTETQAFEPFTDEEGRQGWALEDLDPTTNVLIEDCTITGPDHPVPRKLAVPRSLICLDNCRIATVRHCDFSTAEVAILGLDGAASDSVQIEDCEFFSGLSRAAILNAGTSWLVSGCVFKPLDNGYPGAYSHHRGVRAGALTFQSCWFGGIQREVGTFGSQIVFAGANLVVQGCVIGGNGATNAITIDEDSDGIEIIGNYFDTHFHALEFVNPAPHSAISFHGNTYHNVAQSVAAPAALAVAFINDGGLHGSPAYAVLDIWAEDQLAAHFHGAVAITGMLYKGGGGFEIDHPVNPGDRFLRHSFVESDEMKNVYDGIVVADEKGEAVVELAGWMGALNRAFRYQLTPIGAPAPSLHVRSELREGRFVIAGADPGMSVSWQLTGVRQDSWAEANPILLEEDKSPDERGCYLHPAAHGAPNSRSLVRQRARLDLDPPSCATE